MPHSIIKDFGFPESVSTNFVPFFLGLFLNGRLVIDHSSSTIKAESNNPAAILMDPVVDIVCYGIGKIASCPIARYQFAFLLLLREILQVNYMYHSKFGT